MKISDLKFGDKFTFNGDNSICLYIDTKNHLSQYIYRDYVEDGRLACVPPDMEISPVGSVEQDKKLVWINSSERAPTISDCDSKNCLYICDGTKVERVSISTIPDWVGNEPYLWAPINKAPALPEPVYKLVKAEFPRDFNKVAYTKNRKELGNLVGYDKVNNKYPFIVRNLRNIIFNYSEVYVLAKP